MPAIGISSTTPSSPAASTSFLSTSLPSTTTMFPTYDTTTPMSALRHRHHRVRPPPSSNVVADLIHDVNDTLILPPTNYRKSQIDTEKVKNTFAGGIFGRNTATQPAGQSLASVFLLIFVLIGIVMILMLFYFLAKVCNGPDEERKSKLKTKNGTIVIRNEGNNDRIEVITTKVPYPKRIYELQAEEGFYSCPPSIQHSLNDIFGEDDDDMLSKTASQRSRSVDDEPQKPPTPSPNSLPSNNNQFVRKLTGVGLPPNFKPKDRLQRLQNS